MKKETFIRLVKNCIDHVENAVRIGNGLKDLLGQRSSLTDFMDSLDAIFYDDKMVDDILEAISEEMNDVDGIINTWFYEYRLMNMDLPEYTITKDFGSGTVSWKINSNPDEDEQNLGKLWDILNN